MEQLFEEYGGMIIAIFAVLVLIGLVLCLLNDGGSLYRCIVQCGNAAC